MSEWKRASYGTRIDWRGRTVVTVVEKKGTKTRARDLRPQEEFVCGMELRMIQPEWAAHNEGKE